MTSARGLGRGLQVLINPSASATLLEIDPAQIVPNARQPRTAFDPEAFAELTRSIAADGVLQPLVVRSLGDGTYELIAGERRWRAARAAGLDRVPVVLRQADDRDALVLALVENLVREDLNPIDTARGYAALVDELGLSPSEVAARVGKSRPAVANTLRLLELPDDVLALVADGSLSEGHARAILQAEGQAARRALARRAAREALSVRAVEALARAADRPRTRRAIAAPRWLDADVANDVADAGYRAFELPATVAATADGCRLEIRVRSAEELARLADRLDRVASLAETHIL